MPPEKPPGNFLAGLSLPSFLPSNGTARGLGDGFPQVRRTDFDLIFLLKVAQFFRHENIVSMSTGAVCNQSHRYFPVFARDMCSSRSMCNLWNFRPLGGDSIFDLKCDTSFEETLVFHQASHQRHHFSLFMDAAIGLLTDFFAIFFGSSDYSVVNRSVLPIKGWVGIAAQCGFLKNFFQTLLNDVGHHSFNYPPVSGQPVFCVFSSRLLAACFRKLNDIFGSNADRWQADAHFCVPVYLRSQGNGEEVLI
jgi:hypothetical protein